MKNITLTLTIFLLTCNLLKAEIPQSEKNALLAIAENMYIFTWSEDRPFHLWNGLEISSVNGNDHVTGIKITSTRLDDYDFIDTSSELHNFTYLKYFQLTMQGESDKEIIFDFQDVSNLNYLDELSFSFQSIQTNVMLLNPNMMVDLTTLTKLGIVYHKAGFTLPSNIINLTNLKSLEFHNSKELYPNYINNLVGLESLGLTFKTNDGIYPSYIDDFSNLVNLKSLSIIHDDYQIHDAFFSLPALESLLISQNSLIIPSAIVNYRNNLKSLTLYSGGFSTLDFPALTALETLKYYGGTFTEIPISIQNLVNLNYLLVNGVYVSIPYSISNLENLEELLIVNSYNGSFHNAIYEIPNLKFFMATYYDELPEAIGNFPNIEHIQAQVYNLNTPLPESIGNLSSIKFLEIFLDNPYVNLTIPDSYFDLVNLERLWLEGFFDLDVTNKFSNLTNLSQLYLYNFNGNKENLRGTLNLCQNPMLGSLSITNSIINVIDLRNNQSFANNEYGSYFHTNSITNFYVDDVDVFNNLVANNKIRIYDNLTDYQVSTYDGPCHRTMSNTEITQVKSNNFYPNPAHNFIQFDPKLNVSNLEITNLNGQKFELNIFNNKALVNHLPKGVYIMKYESNGVKYIDRLIKN